MARLTRYKCLPRRKGSRIRQQRVNKREHSEIIFSSLNSQLNAPKLLSPQELTAVLKELEGWSQQEGKLHRQFRFSCFERALGFLSGLAVVAEVMGHHPEESIIYDCVTIDLTTREAGGITNLDVELARKANELAGCLHSSKECYTSKNRNPQPTYLRAE
jgi:4a-hydroxytetrahydrobiopterin dehydratase